MLEQPQRGRISRQDAGEIAEAGNKSVCHTAADLKGVEHMGHYHVQCVTQTGNPNRPIPTPTPFGNVLHSET